MGQFNGNGCYVDIDGTVVDTYFQNVSISKSVETVDSTCGNATWRANNEGLYASKGTISVVYDDTLASTLLPLMEAGTHTLTYGPEGNTAGKPKHVQSIIITDNTIAQNVGKTLVLLESPFIGAAAPTTDMWAGGVWA
jgi:hypothetical protein